ncbi:MAG: ribosome small subunit-dependent GTPase A [Bacteroidetes bacterium]|nr:MAG: ribosome small subunit-dependent GTPase A [Bacteroidota bacterium]
MQGKIFRSVGSWYDILGEDSQKYKGRLRGKFKLDDHKLTNPIAVGDDVGFEIENSESVVITELHDRKNYIIRKSAHKTEHAHIIASNIEEAFLIVTLTMPETSLGFIDRFLVAAESFRIPVSLVFNKSDLWTEKHITYQKQIAEMYQNIGYQSFITSAELQTGIEELKKHLQHKTILFSGHSGVGKSTLMNVLFPTLSQKTAVISNFAQKGVHTTTFAEMFEVSEKTYLIDTPGIKEFGIIDLENNELGHYFPEMRELLNQCKFHNCLHINEPSCAVKNAVEKGKIAHSRYKNYLSIINNEDNRR